MSLKSAAFAAKAFTVKARVGGFHQHLLRNERLAPAELAVLQDDLVKDTVRTAMLTSPYYRRIYGERGVDPDSLTRTLGRPCRCSTGRRSRLTAHSSPRPMPRSAARAPL